MVEINGCFKDAVCIDAGRVYDSCCDRDCLSDLQVCFSESDQQSVETAVGVRAKSAEIINVEVNVEPVTFNRGYYAVDMVFYFSVVCDLYSCGEQVPNTVTGFAVWSKKVILCGGEGSAKIYSSEYNPTGSSNQLPVTANLPKAHVQTVDPVVLAADIACGCCQNDCSCSVPSYVTNVIKGTPYTGSTNRYVAVTLGLFTVVQLVRNVQMLVPVYDFCIPDKECVTTTDDPCELFRRLRFPMDEFFPSDEECSENPLECMHRQSE